MRFTTGAIRVEPDRHHVVLPRIGRVSTHESTRKLARRLQAATARILSATVRYTGGRWVCAFQVIVAGKTRSGHARRSPHRGVGVGGLFSSRIILVAEPPGWKSSATAIWTLVIAIPSQL